MVSGSVENLTNYTNVKTETYFDHSDAAGVQREGADS